MARFVAVLCLALGLISSAKAQVIDRWSTAAECMAATNAPFYHPSILHEQKLGPDEAIRGHPTGGCFDMDLPDRMGGRGFVRTEAGREFVYNLRTGRVLRLAECNNNVYSWVPFGPTRGLQGPPGPVGPQGPQGTGGRDAPAVDMTALVAAMFQNSGEVARPRRDWGWLKPVGWTALGITAGLVAYNNWPKKREGGNGAIIGPAF